MAIAATGIILPKAQHAANDFAPQRRPSVRE
jgi:hypothetical protein